MFKTEHDVVIILLALAIIVVIGLGDLVVMWWLIRKRKRSQSNKDSEAQASLAQLKTQAYQTANEMRADATKTLEQARTLSAEMMEQAERRQSEMQVFFEGQRGELRTLREAIERREQRLNEREDRLSTDINTLTEREERLQSLKATLTQQKEELANLKQEATAELERVAGLSHDQARLEVLATAEHDARIQAASLTRDIEAKARHDGEQIARSIISTAIQRLASEQTAEAVVSTVDLPNEDMKGRIIGREGRNIRSFEQITGVNILIDDTPESVLLSCFDPVRREVARMTLVDLVTDGRIRPDLIESVYQRSLSKVNDRMQRAAEDALAEVGISDLHPDLIPILGALAYRTSYGQNVLKHLCESAHLAGVMAAELGVDIALCKRAAFLHDIGKALTHEVEGSHALIGAELARKYGENPEVVHAIEAHHNEVEPRTVVAVLTQAADAISGSRPGARQESLEAYFKRMRSLEELAANREGVEKVFVMQAGREIRVMVKPDQLDDLAAHALAKEIAKEIEASLTYPGQIKVTVIRECRAIEVAH